MAYNVIHDFQLEKDVENFMRWKMMGGPIMLKKEAVPHIFDCQHTSNIKSKRPRAGKRICNDVEQNNFQPEEPHLTTPTSTPEESCSDLKIKIESLSPSQDMDDKFNSFDENIEVDDQSSKLEIVKTECSPIETTDVDNNVKYLLSSEFYSGILPSDETTEWKPVNEDSEYFDDDSKSIIVKATMLFIEKEPKLYLGIPKEAYFCLEILSKKIPAPLTDVLITLKKIRFNEPCSMLSIQFGRTASNIGQTFRQTVPLMSKHLKELIHCPAPIKIVECLPITFKCRYSKVQFIIDCFEIEIQKPSNPRHESSTWSECMGCNTLKYMISCTPDGLINFVSTGFGGGASDTTIFENCGFVDNLRHKSDIVAYRGFKNIDNILVQCNCKLIRTPSDTPSSKKELLELKKVIPFRIHIERVIGRLRCFNMLVPNACIDLNYLSIFDDIVTIACSLINLDNNVIEFNVT